MMKNVMGIWWALDRTPADTATWKQVIEGHEGAYCRTAMRGLCAVAAAVSSNMPVESATLKWEIRRRDESRCYQEREYLLMGIWAMIPRN